MSTVDDSKMSSGEYLCLNTPYSTSGRSHGSILAGIPNYSGVYQHLSVAGNR
jgi:hypothetical protein